MTGSVAACAISGLNNVMAASASACRPGTDTKGVSVVSALLMAVKRFIRPGRIGSGCNEPDDNVESNQYQSFISGSFTWCSRDLKQGMADSGCYTSGPAGVHPSPP